MAEEIDLDTSRITHWRSIIILIVFVLTNLVVLFPFHIPVYIPRVICDGTRSLLQAARIISPDDGPRRDTTTDHGKFVRMRLSMNFLTAPVIADLFLLAITAIGRTEVRDGTVGSNHIAPLDIMAFFISLAYIAISIDASGLIRFLAFKVLERGGKHGIRLYLYLYIFFFTLASFVGNDPIVLSGTAFLAYMTRVSRNITNAKAWIYAQFAMANVGSAVLVSSNPTNLVLAGAFGIKFIVYTANIIVPVIVTVLILFPCLLLLVFRQDGLVPRTVEMHELPESAKHAPPVNPNIPRPAGSDEDEELKALLEIMHPYVDKKSAAVGVTVMTVTLVTILVLNATAKTGHEHPVFWVTVPGAVVMLCWDLSYGWKHRHESRQAASGTPTSNSTTEPPSELHSRNEEEKSDFQETLGGEDPEKMTLELEKPPRQSDVPLASIPKESESISAPPLDSRTTTKTTTKQRSLQSIIADTWKWLRQTFPTTTVVVQHLPLKLVPFALAMFVLVQSLVTSGWVATFAYGWSHWTSRTGVVGSIGGMAFVSVVLCNFAGTNIGTAILICRVLQSWVEIHSRNGDPISQRMFWATIYSMALGVNYGAFSTAFSASLAGMLWRDILARKHIFVSSRDFAVTNLPIITIAMVVGCVVLIGQVYITRGEEAYMG